MRAVCAGYCASVCDTGREASCAEAPAQGGRGNATESCRQPAPAPTVWSHCREAHTATEKNPVAACHLHCRGTWLQHNTTWHEHATTPALLVSAAIACTDTRLAFWLCSHAVRGHGPAFRRDTPPPPSGWNSRPSKEPASRTHNIGLYLKSVMLHPTTPQFSYANTVQKILKKLQILQLTTTKCKHITCGTQS
jgi:hypothetical protein